MIDPETGEETAVRGPSKLVIAVRRYWVVIVAVAIAGAILGYVGSKVAPNTYTATGEIFVNEPANANNVTGDIQTVARLVVSDPVLKQVANDQGVTVSFVRSHTSAVPASGANVVDLTATARTAREAVRLVNATYQAFTTVSPGFVGGQQRTTSSTYLAAPQPPDGPSSPRPLRNAGIGLVLGVLLTVGFFWLREIRQPTAADTDLASRTMRVPLFADLTASTGHRHHWRGSRDRSITTLSLDLDELAPRGTRILAFGAARPGDLSPTLSLELAEAFASGGWRIVVVDGDAREGALSRSLGLSEAAGLSDLIGSDADIGDRLVPAGPNKLWVLPAGQRGLDRTQPNLSAELRRVLAELKTVCDLALLVVPGMGQDAEARLLAAQADGVVVVVRGSTPIASLDGLRERLELFHARLIGIVRDEPDRGHRRVALRRSRIRQSEQPPRRPRDPQAPPPTRTTRSHDVVPGPPAKAPDHPAADRPEATAVSDYAAPVTADPVSRGLPPSP